MGPLRPQGEALGLPHLILPAVKAVERGGEDLVALGKVEADEAVLGLRVEAAAWHGADANLAAQVNGEGLVGGVAKLCLQRGDVCHNVVGALGLHDAEAKVSQAAAEELALVGVEGGQVFVVALWQGQAGNGRLHERCRGAHGQEVVHLLDAVGHLGGRDHVTQAPAGHGIRLAERAAAEGARLHAGERREVDVLVRRVDYVLVYLVGYDPQVVLVGETGNGLQLGQGEHVAGGVGRVAQDERLGARLRAGSRKLGLVEAEAGCVQRDVGGLGAAQDGVLQNAAVEGSTMRDINGEVEIDDRNDMMNYKVSSSGDTITGNQVVMLTGKVDMDNDPTTITSPGNGALSIVTGEDMTVTTDTATGAVTPQTLTTSYFGNVRTKGATINGFDKMNVYTSNYLDQDSTITASSTSAAPEVNILAVDEVSAPGSYTAHYAGSANTNELQGNSMTLEGTTIKSQGTSGGSVNLKSGDLVLGENPGVNSRKSELVASALTAVSAKPITIESPNVSTEAFSTYKTDNATTSATSHALHSESNYDILTSKAQPNDTGAVLIGADSVIKTDNLTMSGYEISASSAKLTAKNISAAAGDALSGKAENGVTVYGAGTGATVTDVTKNAKLPKTDASGTKISATTLSSSDAATVKAPAVATPTTPTVLKDDFKAPVDAGSLTSKDIPAEVTAAEAAAAGKDAVQLNKENAATVMENVLDNYDGIAAQKEAAGDLARNTSKAASSKDAEAAQIAGFIEGVDAMSDLSDAKKAEVKKSAVDSFSTVQGANGDIANEGQNTEDRAAKKDEVKDTQSESDTTANHFVDDRTTIIVE